MTIHADDLSFEAKAIDSAGIFFEFQRYGALLTNSTIILALGHCLSGYVALAAATGAGVMALYRTYGADPGEDHVAGFPNPKTNILVRNNLAWAMGNLETMSIAACRRQAVLGGLLSGLCYASLSPFYLLSSLTYRFYNRSVGPG